MVWGADWGVNSLPNHPPNPIQGNAHKASDQGAVATDVLEIGADLVFEFLHEGVRVPFLDGLADHGFEVLAVSDRDRGYGGVVARAAQRVGCFGDLRATGRG